MKPVILTTGDFVESGRATAIVYKNDYARCITAAGGIPMGAGNVARAADYAAFADALLLTDGPGIHVSRYGDTQIGPMLGNDTQRDDLDFALCRAFMAAGKPILGIGRGAQVLNVALGGTVDRKLKQYEYDDAGCVCCAPEGYSLAYEPVSRFTHEYGIHSIETVGSALLPDGTHVVNTFHTTANKDLGEGLKVTAVGPDGVVEAVENAEKHWYGIQWHPELDRLDCRADQRIFDKFVAAARPFALQPRPRTDRAVITVGGGVCLDPVFEQPGWILFSSYLHAVGSADGLVVVPMDESCAQDYAEITDGLIMTGSASWVPRPALRAKAMVDSENRRTVLDRALFHAFEDAVKPIFGICLGMQRINQHTGGCMSRQFKTKVGVEHMLSEHLCLAEDGSLLHKLFGPRFMVNSRHNCRIEEAGKGMKITARAPDGTIEATEHESLPIYGFQFHPERTRGDMPDPPTGPDSTPLFKELIRMALEHRK